MRRVGLPGVGVACALLVGGCRTETKVTEVPRVDLRLEGGNRGYLVGTPPDAGAVKPTRQLLEATIEVPSFYTPKRPRGAVSLEGFAPPETAPPDVAVPVQRADAYVVQQGDSLWSIAAQPEIYGKATQWRRIFDANRDLLKSPDRLRAGMTLTIPREDDGGATTYEDEGLAFKK